VEEEGQIVLNARTFGEIVRKGNDDEIIISADEKFFTNIKCGFADFKISGISFEEFPELPKPSVEKAFKMPQVTLKSMIRQTIFAVAEVNTKPVLTGALFEINQSSIKVV